MSDTDPTIVGVAPEARPRDEDGIQLVEGIDPFTRKMFVAYGMAFERLAYPVYQGTVPHHVKAKRRAKDKVAKRSRKLNRGRN